MTTKPKAGLRERNKQDKLARIEKAARTLFAEHGYEATTTRQIAKRAKIGMGTLFVYFPEKRDLLFHLFRSLVYGFAETAFADVPDGPLVDRLMTVFDRLYAHLARDQQLSRVFVKEIGFVTDRERVQTAPLAMDIISRLAKLVSEAQERGEIDRSLLAVEIAYHIAQAHLAALISWLGGAIPVRENQLALLRGGLQLLYRGLAPR